MPPCGSCVCVSTSSGPVIVGGTYVSIFGFLLSSRHLLSAFDASPESTSTFSPFAFSWFSLTESL